MEDYEKLYKEAIHRASGFRTQECKYVAEYIFPELKESEDEDIRKALIHFFSNTENTSFEYWEGIPKSKVLAWLEKQGETSPILSDSSNIGKDAWSEEEQNRFAKVVLTSCALSFIDYLDAHKYEDKMCVSNGECEDIENAFHNAMWDRLHRYYCKYIENQGEQKPVDPVAIMKDYFANTPKEQQEKDWAELKHLNDVGFGIEIPFGAKDSELQEVSYYIPEGFHAEIESNRVNIKRGEQKPAWSEEDREYMKSLLDIINGTLSLTPSEVECHKDWLKSLKNRVQPLPKQEWSQNDIDMIDWLIRCCEKEHEELCNDKYGHQDIVSDLKRDCRKKWNWLESLKNKVVPQNRWKPSDEQIEALHDAIIYVKDSMFPSKNVLKKLYWQLKKLREA